MLALTLAMGTPGIFPSLVIAIVSLFFPLFFFKVSLLTFFCAFHQDRNREPIFLFWTTQHETPVSWLLVPGHPWGTVAPTQRAVRTHQVLS